MLYDSGNWWMRRVEAHGYNHNLQVYKRALQNPGQGNITRIPMNSRELHGIVSGRHRNELHGVLLCLWSRPGSLLRESSCANVLTAAPALPALSSMCRASSPDNSPSCRCTFCSDAAGSLLVGVCPCGM